VLPVRLGLWTPLRHVRQDIDVRLFLSFFAALLELLLTATMAQPKHLEVANR
jgi:hypothetical protein